MTLQLKAWDPELEAICKIRPPVRLKHFLVKRDHRNRLLELSEKSVGQIPQLVEPSYEQKEWFVRKMKAPARAWETAWVIRKKRSFT